MKTAAEYDHEQALMAVRMVVYLELALSYLPQGHRQRAQELVDQYRTSREAEHAQATATAVAA